jgi:hypothetical protein
VSAERILFLDIDGVLNRTGFRPATSEGLRSWIEPELAERLSNLLRTIGASIVLSSDWRTNRDLPLLREELQAAGVRGKLIGATPVFSQQRWREIQAWMVEHRVDLHQIAIVDDTYDMGPLAPRFVRVNPMSGLDETIVRALLGLFAA